VRSFSPLGGEKVVLTLSVAKGKDRMRGVSLEAERRISTEILRCLRGSG